MGGRELASLVTQLHPGLPVLFASGLPNDNAPEREQLSGDQDFLQKPFTAEMLARKVGGLERREQTYC
jgi:FixJ family two-component response regulator